MDALSKNPDHGSDGRFDLDLKSFLWLEPISKLSEQQNHGGNLHKPEKILRIQLPAIQ
jgi:hypothetical protein